MRRPRRNDDEVAEFGVDVRVAFGVEADGAAGHEEGLVVHFVPVLGRAGGVGRDGEFGAADAVVCAYGEGGRVSVVRLLGVGFVKD